MLVMTNVMSKIMLAQSIIKAYWLILTWATATVLEWDTLRTFWSFCGCHPMYSQSPI